MLCVCVMAVAGYFWFIIILIIIVIIIIVRLVVVMCCVIDIELPQWINFFLHFYYI